MRVIIAGSRGVTNPALLEWAMGLAAEQGIVPSTVVSGTARGIDCLGEAWAEARGIPVDQYPADWDRLGKRAGPFRNHVMAQNADALVAVWDGKSRGTAHMILTAREAGLRVFVVPISEYPFLTLEGVKV